MSKPTMTGIGAVLGKRAAKHARKQARKLQRTPAGWRAPVAPEASNGAGEQGPNPLEAPTADELGPGIENGKGEGPGITPSHVSECGRPSDAELTFSIGRMPKEARNG